MSIRRITRRQLLGGAALALTACSSRQVSMSPLYQGESYKTLTLQGANVTKGFCDEVSGIYVILATGGLLWYKDVGLPQTAFGSSQTDYLVKFSNRGVGSQIGNGWQKFRDASYAGNGVIYAVDTSNNLYFFRDRARNGTIDWAPGSGNIIARNWAFKQVIGGEGGVIFAHAADNSLRWYQDLARNGTAHWSPNSGSIIARSWNFAQLFYAGGGVIYAVQSNSSHVFWYRYTGSNGSSSWDRMSGTEVATIGSKASHYFANYYGDMYGLFADDAIASNLNNGGQLLRSINLTRKTSFPPVFSTIAEQEIGIGWDRLKRVRGYCTPLSVAAGQAIGFRLAAGAGNPSVTVNIRRLTYTAPYGRVMAGPTQVTAVYRGVPQQPWAMDHQWPVAFSLQTGSSWPSGLYAAECVDGAGRSFWVTFIVRPPFSPQNRIAVLSHINTWNAYNKWGGLNQYSSPNGTPLTFNRPNALTSPVDNHTFHNHLTRAELYISNWLDSEHIGYDMYSDLDLHNGTLNLQQYKLVVLSAHPEYWTDAMRTNLSNYMSKNGSLIYLGGNAIYERVALESTGSQLQFRNGLSPGGRDVLPAEDRWAILGISSAGSSGHGADATSYKVTPQGAAHPFFARRVTANQNIGGEINAYNGVAGTVGASGWETDTAPCTIVNQRLTRCASGYPAGAQLLAQGNNTHSVPADMVYYPKAKGGFVLSMGSITFGGALLVDTYLQTLIRNAVNAALNP